MDRLKHKYQWHINWTFLLILILGILLSMFVYLRGNQIVSSTGALIEQDIPNYQGFAQLYSVLTEQERLLYEFYASEDDALINVAYKATQGRATEITSALRASFGENPSLQATLEAMGQIETQALDFVGNIRSPQTNWDQARSQLAAITAIRQSVLGHLQTLEQLTKTAVDSRQSAIEQGLSQVRNFVIAYGLVTLVIVVLIGRALKLYLATAATSQRLSLFPKRNPNPIISLDEGGNVTFTNPATHSLLSSLDLEPDDYRQLLTPDLTSYQQETRINDSGSTRFEYKVLGKHFECTLNWLADQRQWDMHMTDVSARKAAEQKLVFQANHHPETELGNLYQLQDLVNALCERGETFALGLVDIRHFNHLLSSRGLQTVKALTKELSVALNLAMIQASESSVYHIGDKSFAILALGRNEDNKVSELVSQVLVAVGNARFTDNYPMRLDFGFSFYPEHGTDRDTLFRNARVALDNSARSDDNFCNLFTHEMGQRLANQQALIESMDLALKGSGFELYFQPQLCLTTHSVVGAEALLRWQLNDQWVSPGEFIPLAERSDLILRLGHWVLNEACKTCRQLQEAGHDMVIAVNISPRQFGQKNFVTEVQDIVAAHGIKASSIELEITEGVLVENVLDTIEALAQLKNAGFWLAIDDFGTGYSSLSYLKQFNLDKLKIDQSFIRQLETDSADKAIVRTIIDLGNNLKLKLIAEGVEEREQMDLLKNMGCDEIQGYYFSKPLPRNEFLEFIDNRH